MAGDPYVVPALPEHAVQMGPHVREVDRQEIWASGRCLPTPALLEAVSMVGPAWTVLRDEEPVLMFGAAATGSLAPVGVPWMLATDNVYDIAYRFLKHSREYVAKMMVYFPILTNYVDARNTITIRWLKWCGFDISDPEPYGIDQLPFHRIEMRAV